MEVKKEGKKGKGKNGERGEKAPPEINFCTGFAAKGKGGEHRSEERTQERKGKEWETRKRVN